MSLSLISVVRNGPSRLVSTSGLVATVVFVLTYLGTMWVETEFVSGLSDIAGVSFDVVTFVLGSVVSVFVYRSYYFGSTRRPRAHTTALLRTGIRVSALWVVILAPLAVISFVNLVYPLVGVALLVLFAYLFTRVLFAPLSMIIESAALERSLRRSWTLTKPNQPSVFLVLVVSLAVVLGPGVAESALGFPSQGRDILLWSLTGVGTALGFALTTDAYHQLAGS